MARNHEKHATRLNRLYLEQQWEEEKKKKPPRPKLFTLSTVDEIKKWLPSITEDINFNLMQSQVTCYTERKIEEFRDEIDRLKREYWAFVRKLRELDPSCDVVPWTERAYGKKRPAQSQVEDSLSQSSNDEQENERTKYHSEIVSSVKKDGEQSGNKVQTKVRRLALPLLQGETEKQYISSQQDHLRNLASVTDLENSLCQDQPLTFCWDKRVPAIESGLDSSDILKSGTHSTPQPSQISRKTSSLSNRTLSSGENVKSSFSGSLSAAYSSKGIHSHRDQTGEPLQSASTSNNPLGLTYDSSDTDTSDNENN